MYTFLQKVYRLKLLLMIQNRNLILLIKINRDGKGPETKKVTIKHILAKTTIDMNADQLTSANTVRGYVEANEFYILYVISTSDIHS